MESAGIDTARCRVRQASWVLVVPRERTVVMLRTCLLLPVMALVLLSSGLSAAPVDFKSRNSPTAVGGLYSLPWSGRSRAKGRDLRLDVKDGAIADLGGHAAIVPGKPDESELLKRITSTDPDEMMPPTGTGKRREPREVELLRRWIAEGANYAVHWAYQAPKKATPPKCREFAKFAQARSIVSPQLR